MKLNVLWIAGLMLAATAGQTHAAMVLYSASDVGASAAGPWVNSAAAEANFLGTLGVANTITFEDQVAGFYKTFAAAPGVTVNLADTTRNFGNRASGISSDTYGNLWGFNVTSGGRKWLGFPESSATFTFDTAIDAFGFYLTGTQTIFSKNITVSFNDGTFRTLNAPINNASGGASYFGFTNAGKFINAITIDSGPRGDDGGDLWGIDNITYGTVRTASAVPEPASLAMWGLGAIGLVFARRKRQQMKLAA